MRPTIGGLAAVAATLIAVLTLAGMHGIAAYAWHGAQEATAAGADAAAERLRLTSALLTVLSVFLLGMIGLVAHHASSQVRLPLDELASGMRRLGTGALNERVVPQGPRDIQRLAREVNQLAATLGRRQAQAEHMVAVQTIDALLSGVAHEVHTPLTTLRVDHHMLKRRIQAIAAREDLPDDVRANATRALTILARDHANHERMGRLTRALTEVVHDAGPEGEVDVNLLVSATVAITHHRSPGNVRVETDLQATQPVRCPASDVFHAVHALVLQASERVRQAGTIRVATEDTQDGVAVVLHYDGPPMPPEMLELLDAGPLDGGTSLAPLHAIQRLVQSDRALVSHGVHGAGAMWRLQLTSAMPAPDPPQASIGGNERASANWGSSSAASTPSSVM